MTATPDNSYIERTRGMVTYVGPDATALYRAIMIRHAIAGLQVGIIPTRGATMTRVLAAATSITRKPYRRTHGDRAIADLTSWIEAMRAAMPVIRRGA